MVQNMRVEDVGRKEKLCPQCQEGTYYQLADGRRMCRSCRRKYTIKVRRSRLESATQKELARGFWEELSAEKAAQQCLVNRKTAQRYYLRIRRALEKKSRQRLVQLGCAVAAENLSQYTLTKLLNILPRVGPQMVIVPLHAEVLTLFEDEYDELRWLASARAGPSVPGDMSWSPQCWADSAKMVREAEAFWHFAQRRLGAYRGGTGKNYRLFIKEVEFRYNQQKEHEVVQLLIKMISPY